MRDFGFYRILKNGKSALLLYGIAATMLIVYVEFGTTLKKRAVLQKNDALMSLYPGISSREVPTALIDLLGDPALPLKKQKVIQLRSRDPGEKIISFYRQDFLKRGYRIVNDSPGVIVAEGGGFSMMVSTLEKDGHTLVFITIEKLSGESG